MAQYETRFEGQVYVSVPEEANTCKGCAMRKRSNCIGLKCASRKIIWKLKEEKMNLKELLKPGLFIKARNERIYLLVDVDGTLCRTRWDTYGNLKGIKDDLTFNSPIDREYDIMEILQPKAYERLEEYMHEKNLEIVWKRKEHIITIDGKEIILSEESFNNLRDQLNR